MLYCLIYVITYCTIVLYSIVYDILCIYVILLCIIFVYVLLYMYCICIYSMYWYIIYDVLLYCIVIYSMYYIGIYVIPMHWSLDGHSKGENDYRLIALHFWLTIFVFWVNVFFYWNVWIIEYVFIWICIHILGIFFGNNFLHFYTPKKFFPSLTNHSIIILTFIQLSFSYEIDNYFQLQFFFFMYQIFFYSNILIIKVFSVG